MRHTIVHFEIPADDPERASGFYRQVFGWEISKVHVGEIDYWPIRTVPSDATGKPTEPGVNGGILKRQHPNQPPVNHVQVEDIGAMTSAIEAAGGQIVVPKMPVPGLGYIAFYKDTEGNIGGLFQPDPGAVPA